MRPVLACKSLNSEIMHSAHDGRPPRRPERFECVLGGAGKEVRVAEQMAAELPPVGVFLSLITGVHPDLTEGQLIDQDVMFFRPVENA